MKNIIENNKLIAEFMGLRTTQAAPLRGGEYRTIYNIETLPAINIPVGSHGIHAVIGTRLLWANPEQLVFHTSWDWLMPVVHKIHELTNVDDQHPLREAGDKVVEQPLRSDMQEVYESVLQFINWYNAIN